MCISLVILRKVITGIALACSLYACESEPQSSVGLPDLGIELVHFEREDGNQTTKYHFHFDVVNNSPNAIYVPFDVQTIHHFGNGGKKFNSVHTHNIASPFGSYGRESIYVVLENSNVSNKNCQDLSILVDGLNHVPESNEENNHFIVD